MYDYVYEFGIIFLAFSDIPIHSIFSLIKSYDILQRRFPSPKIEYIVFS
jgi:hypothetical protein